MAVGLIVRNDNRIVQIDDRLKNLVLVAKGTGHTNSIQDRSSDIYLNFDAPLVVAVEARNGAVVFSQGKVNGSWHFIVNSGSYEPYTWYAFATQYPPETENFGLRVFNEYGELRYSSSHKTCNIVGLFNQQLPVPYLWATPNTPTQNLPEQPWTMPSINMPIKDGRKYATISLTTPVMSYWYRVHRNNAWYAAADIWTYLPINTGSGINFLGFKSETYVNQIPKPWRGQFAPGNCVIPATNNTMTAWVIDITGL